MTSKTNQKGRPRAGTRLRVNLSTKISAETHDFLQDSLHKAQLDAPETKMGQIIDQAIDELKGLQSERVGWPKVE